MEPRLWVGRFFAEFGRLSLRHDHELPFVNRPLVIMVGGVPEAKTCPDLIEPNLRALINAAK